MRDSQPFPAALSREGRHSGGWQALWVAAQSSVLCWGLLGMDWPVEQVGMVRRVLLIRLCGWSRDTVTLRGLSRAPHAGTPGASVTVSFLLRDLLLFSGPSLASVRLPHPRGCTLFQMWGPCLHSHPVSALISPKPCFSQRAHGHLGSPRPPP